MLPLLSAGGSHWGFSLRSNPLKTSSFILLVSSSHKSATSNFHLHVPSQWSLPTPIKFPITFQSSSHPRSIHYEDLAVQRHGHTHLDAIMSLCYRPCSLTIVLHLPRQLGLKFYRKNELGLALYATLLGSPTWFSKLLLMTLKALRWTISQTSLLYSVTQN